MRVRTQLARGIRGVSRARAPRDPSASPPILYEHMFRPRDITARARQFAENVLAASDLALGGDGDVALEAGGPAPHPHRRAAELPRRDRRAGRVSPTQVPCLSPAGHRIERRTPLTAPRG